MTFVMTFDARHSTISPAFEPTAFDAVHHQWTSVPQSWDAIPEAHILAQETHAQIRRAVQQLPASQQTVIGLRDIAGWSSAEVCASLGISEANQRVLLHRARARYGRRSITISTKPACNRLPFVETTPAAILVIH